MLNMKNKLYENLKTLRVENGFYRAADGLFYRQFCWLRDLFYESLPSLDMEPNLYVHSYHSLLDYLIRLENEHGKFSKMIAQPHPKEEWRYLHARVTADTCKEIHSYWRNKQNDICGELLYGIALGEKKGLKIIRDDKDTKVLNLLIKYMEAIECWHDSESGMWEEGESYGTRSSSVGACIAGLIAIKDLNRGDIIIPDYLIMKCKITLSQMLPRETKDRCVDMALLSLIYPFNVVTESQRNEILYNVETQLTREYGVIRYHNDMYMNGNYCDPVGNEAQWTMGLLYLSIIYAKMNDFDKAKKYLYSVLDKCPDGKIPEAYINGEPCENKILGWSNALAYIAIEEIFKI